ncbi:tetratricopeptide repeat protein [Aureibacter tunicatorum]|nr:tetratricopeptide repeat protein [Aureibacter tunicatorum]
MKKLLLLIIHIIIFQVSQAQNSSIKDYEQKLAVEKNDSVQMHLLARLAFAYWDSDHYKSRELAEKSLKINEKYNEKHIVSINLNTIGISYWTQGEYDKALEYFLKTVEMCEEDSHYIGMGSAYINIGIIYKAYGQYHKAIKYQEKAIAAHEKIENFDGIIAARSNIGLNYVYLKEYEKALEELKIAEELLIQSNNENNTVAIYIYEYRGQAYDELGDYDKALTNYNKALELSKKLNGVKSMTSNMIHVADVYIKKKQYAKVEGILNEAIEKAEKMNFNSIVQDAYLKKSEFFEKINDKEAALNAYKSYSALKDSIFNTEKSKQIAEMQVKYEADKKEKENLIYKAKSERQTIISATIGLSLTLLLILTAILFKNYSAKRKTNKVLEGQKEELEKKNNKIIASINYAERIQKAALTDVEEIQNIPEHFIFFQPKDIVSGDFYWFYEKDNKIVICAADCTGHGVPGAFMSMLGISFLNRIVSEKNILEPHLILDELHAQVENALRQDKTQNRDGMDISLCVMDLDKNILEFAGAKNSLICIHNDEVTRIKGDKLSVGGRKTKHRSNFTKQVIKIEEEMHFYISSDGFQDQFGGEDGNKFMAKPFRSLLKDIHHHSFDDQKFILESKINSWMKIGNQKQVDDILVIGFKFAPSIKTPEQNTIHKNEYAQID